MADRKPGKFSKERQFKRDDKLDELKVPPHSLEAEQSVLGGYCLITKLGIVSVRKLLLKIFIAVRIVSFLNVLVC